MAWRIANVCGGNALPLRFGFQITLFKLKVHQGFGAPSLDLLGVKFHPIEMHEDTPTCSKQTSYEQ